MPTQNVEMESIDAIKGIRAEQDYFKLLCLNTQMNLSRLVSVNVQAGRGLERYELFAIYATIRNFESDCIGILTVRDYYPTRDVLIEELKKINMDNKNKRKDYFDKLMEWKDLLIRTLAKETNYLPAKRVGLRMDNGRVIERDQHYNSKENRMPFGEEGVAEGPQEE